MSEASEEKRGDPEFIVYAAKRIEAQAKLVQASIDRRRHSGPPDLCDMEYEVLDR